MDTDELYPWWAVQPLEVHEPLADDACPCCGHVTASSRRDICPVCYWENDGSDNDCLDTQSGPNATTLRQGRVSFLRIGACDMRAAQYVRPATADEVQLRRFSDQGEELPPQ